MAINVTDGTDWRKALAKLEADQKSARKRAVLQRAYRALGWEPTYTVKDSELTALFKLMRKAIERPNPQDVSTMESHAAQEALRAAFELFRQTCELIDGIRKRRIDPAHDYRKRAGGRASGRKRQTVAQERGNMIIARWDELVKQGKKPETCSGIIAREMNLKPYIVRRDLRNARMKR
jgi:hypothetical protein